MSNKVMLLTFKNGKKVLFKVPNSQDFWFYDDDENHLHHEDRCYILNPEVSKLLEKNISGDVTVSTYEEDVFNYKWTLSVMCFFSIIMFFMVYIPLVI